MSLQRIINKAETIQINRRKVIGIQYSKSQMASAAETVTRNPWQLTVRVSAALLYDDPETRSILETIDNLDRNTSEVIALNSLPKLSWLFKYNGALTPVQLSNFIVDSFNGKELRLASNFQGIQIGTVLFKAGDFVQVKDKPYPFTIKNDVTLTQAMVNAGKVTLTTHRGNFIVDDVQGKQLNFGNDVQFRVFCPNMPTYTIIPGGRYGMVQFDSDFQLYEWTGYEL